MRFRKTAACLSFMILSGCAHVRESSATADAGEIKTRLMAQLNCSELDLEQESPHCFRGSGKNGTGLFTIEATRKGKEIVFNGAYSEPVQGRFKGTASWRRSSTAFFGIRGSRYSTTSSLQFQKEMPGTAANGTAEPASTD